MARLPTPGGDNGNWGDILNDFLSQSHTSTGAIKSGAVSKSDVGLGNVDNTSDANKPVSTAQQTALDLKLDTTDLDAQTAVKINDTASATSTALLASYAKGNKYASRLAIDAMSSLKLHLDAAERSAGTWVGSDSTSNDTTDWYYQWAQLVANSYPDWTVEWRRWEDATQDLGVPTRIQTGPAGERYMDCSTGTLSRSLDTTVSPHLTGTIDVRVKLSRGVWTGTAPAGSVCGRTGGVGERSWYTFFQTNNGRPQFIYSVDGTNLVTMGVSVAPTVTNGAVTWIRWVFNPNDGAGNHTFKAYQSADGVTWTQLGSTVTVAGTVTLFDNSATRGFTIGNSAGGAIGDASAKIYEVEIRDGENGPSVCPARPEHWPQYAGGTGTASSIVGSPVLSVINGGKAGGTIEYLLGTESGSPAPNRLATSMRDFGHRLIILSQSHNMGKQFGDQWTNRWNSFLSAIEDQRPGVPVISTTQNPETSDAANQTAHAQRMRELPGIMACLARGTVDTYRAILDYPDGWENFIKTDGAGVHPDETLSGYYAQVMFDPLTVA